ncbi:MAG: RusA family crossover junction endodeoxyribonuclease [Bacilli bacterium]
MDDWKIHFDPGEMMITAFLLAEAPRSFNAKKKERYYQAIQNAYNSYVGALRSSINGFYIRIYYFSAFPLNIDADNISKPIVDALRTVAYTDDNEVVYRICAKIDLRMHKYDDIDVNGVPSDVAEPFVDAISSEEHLLYIEIGPFEPDMIQFGREERK